MKILPGFFALRLLWPYPSEVGGLFLSHSRRRHFFCVAHLWWADYIQEKTEGDFEGFFGGGGRLTSCCW